MCGNSSNINEVIRSVLNFLFFYDRISQVQKSTKRIQGTKKYQKVLKSIKTQPDGRTDGRRPFNDKWPEKNAEDSVL